MKKLIVIVGLISLFAYTACADDISETQECVSCTSDDSVTTTFCYYEGAREYTKTVGDGKPESIPLPVDATWEQIKNDVGCDNEVDPNPNQDCFDCTLTVGGQSVTTTYCYTEGATEYTATINGVTQTFQLPDGITWEQFKQGQQQLCE